MIQPICYSSNNNHTKISRVIIELSIAYSANYLGITIDQSLTFKLHLLNLSNKLP